MEKLFSESLKRFTLGCSEPVFHCAAFQNVVGGLILLLSSHVQYSASVYILFFSEATAENPISQR